MGSKKKYRTYIGGLDKLLGGGFCLADDDSLSIVIKGETGTYSTLFGLQMLYGLALAFRKKYEKDENRDGGEYHESDLYFVRNVHTETQLEEMMLDTFIPYCISSLRRLIIANGWEHISDLDEFTNFFFDRTKILATPILTSLPLEHLKKDPERLIAENVMFYDIKTKTLCYRTMNNRVSEENMVYGLACGSINEYIAQKEKGDNSKIIGSMERRLKVALLKTQFLKYDDWREQLPESRKVNVAGIEAGQDENIRILIENLRKRAKISIVIADARVDVSGCGADFVLDLQKEVMNGYTLRYVNLIHDSLYNVVSGMHQYKVRESGIEVFPGLQTYLKGKMSLHRSVNYTHASMHSDTFPQYLEKMRNRLVDWDKVSYDDFLERNKTLVKEYLERKYTHQGGRYGASDLLSKILLPTSKEILEGKGNSSYDYSGLVTAVIGEGNTFKRYLTMGSAFSSAVNGEDTLILSLNRENFLIQSRTSCPMLSSGKAHKDKCLDCFEHFHFMNLYPEHITPEEFIYLLAQDIKTGYGPNRYVKRIILDGLQVLDYNFPLLKKSGFFLSAAMSKCREKNIALYVICDKHLRLCEEIRALADNVVCTQKDSKGKLRIYIEKCSGYYNPPSTLYCGEIENVYHLFECNGQYEKSNSGYSETYKVMLNSRLIKNRTIHDMKEFWND